jgi:hypothetical protein
MALPIAKPAFQIPEVPFLKNYPKTATFVRGALLWASATIFGATIGFMNAKGFSNFWIDAMLPFAIPAVLVSGLTLAWNVAVKNALLKDFLTHMLDMAEGAPMPLQLAKQATPAQLDRAAQLNILPAPKEVIQQKKV